MRESKYVPGTADDNQLKVHFSNSDMNSEAKDPYLRNVFGNPLTYSWEPRLRTSFNREPTLSGTSREVKKSTENVQIV